MAGPERLTDLPDEQQTFSGADAGMLDREGLTAVERRVKHRRRLAEHGLACLIAWFCS